MEFGFTPETPKEKVFEVVQEHLGNLAIGINSVDSMRPWGGFFVIDRTSTDTFIQQYYPGYDIAKIKQYGEELQPKILIVAPDEILSWQFHYRRAEIWSGVFGPVGYHRSADDRQGNVHILQSRQVVQFDPLERHRLKGLTNWGVVAEFWQHTDPENPSNEDDIVRLDDKYGR